MVDIHSHILPGVDDGARDMDESLAMLHMAARCGTTDIVATPHAHRQYPFDPEVLEKIFNELAVEVEGLIQLHQGCDFHLDFDNLSDALRDPTRYTINGGRYLMVELPDYCSLPVMRTALARLLALRVVPVITHPERNGPVCANLRELEAWVQDGCLVQVTGQSLTGAFGQQAQRVSETLLNSNLVHFIASDAHDCVERPPDLSVAYKRVAEGWGEDRAEALFNEHPTAVIQDEPIFTISYKATSQKSSKKASGGGFWD